MKFDVIQSNFTAGELSPKLKGRVDLEKYLAGLAVCENMVVQPAGGVSRRGGFHYVTEVKNSAKTTILLAFRYNDLYSYVLEFGENYIRVYFENEQIQSGGSPYEIATTYLESEVADLPNSITQDATSLYIAHKNHAPAVLTRTDHDAWTLQDIPFSFDYAYEDSWLAISTGLTDGFWMDVCWSPGLNLFCAVSLIGSNGKVAVSKDGLTWKYYNSSDNDYYWQSVCWSSSLNLFCAVAIGGTGSNMVMTSSDGVTWTPQTVPESNQWTSICWASGLSLFCAVSLDGTNRIMTSPDGETWTARAAASAQSWSSVCYAFDLATPLLCAVADDGTASSIMTSPDGINWTSRVAPVSKGWTSVCWSSDQTLFVTVGGGLVGSGVMTSPDGVNWTSRVPATTDEWRSVCWAADPGLFVAVAATGANRVMTSPDGIAWTIRTAASSDNWQSVCWSPDLNLLVSVADLTGDSAMVSVDGINWTFLDSHQWQSVCWSPERAIYVAVSSSGTGNRVATSPDGISWIARPSAADIDWRSVCWSPLLTLFIAVADSGAVGRMMTSPEGVTWELVSEITQTVDNDWKSICWSSDLSLFVAVSETGTNNRIITSPDGVVWSTQVSPADNNWQSVCWSSALTLFVAVSSSGVGNRVMTSPDGVVWTIRVSAADNGWTSVCWSSALTLFVAVSSSGVGNRVMTSPNGINWTIQVSSADNDWTSVCWSPEIPLFVAVSTTVSTTNVMTSPDGINWTTRTSGLNSKWESICWHSTQLKFVAVASSGGVRGMYSSDGVTWASSEVGMWEYTEEDPYVDPEDWETTIDYMPLYSVCEYQGMFIAIGGGVGSSPVRYFTWKSSNGVTWAEHEVIENSWRAICGAPEIPLLVAVADTGTGNRIATSTDAENWSTWEFEIQNNKWESVCWSPKLRIFVAVAMSGNKRVGVSSTGKSWWFYEAAALNDWQSVCWSPEKELFVAVSSSGVGNRVMISGDGRVWTPGTSAADNIWQSVCWSPKLSLFCAVASTGSADRVMTSPDGVSWTSRIPAIDYDWTSVCWSEELERFVAVASSGSSNRIMTSSDGVTWESDTSPVDNNWKEICWSPELKQFVAVADTGTNDRVMYSITSYESWSTFDEYPSLVWFYEQRLFFAATTENPNMIWGSKSADFFNMTLGKGLDNDAIKLEVKTAYNFLWVSAGEEILIGGSNAEFSLSANALNEALTPSNVRPALRTKFGGAVVPPLRIDDSVIFVQQGIRKLRRLSSASQVGGYSNVYKASDLNILNSHITESGIVGVVSQKVMDTIIWAFRNDGVLVGLTYEPEHNIFGWHKHTIGGADTKVKSLAIAEVVATGGNQPQDELWAIIERTINGGTKKYIEYMREGLHAEDSIEDSFFIDAGITKTGTAFTVVNDLDHLEGETVAILGDGVEQAFKTVSSGTITLDTAVDKAQIGLSFTSIMETLPLEGGNPVGTSQGLIKRIASLTLRLYRSLGVDVGDTAGNVDSYVFDSTDLFTGDTEPIPFAGAHDRQSRVKISSNHPLPLNLLSIIAQARTK